MGYTRSTLKLVWPEDSEFSGLEVRMKRLSIRKLTELQALFEVRTSLDEKQAMEAFQKIVDIVAGSLIGWNLEIDSDEGEATTPVPATRESLADQDPEMVLELVTCWMKVATGVPLDSVTTSDTTPLQVPLQEEWADWALPSQEPLSERV